MRRDGEHQPVSVKELALNLPRSAFETIAWRKGACEPLSSRFARVRVCPAHRDYNLTAPRPEEWLLIEWPQEEPEPTKYWLSTLPQTTGFASLVDTAKLRWRIERGKRTFIGRGWRGFHHHATLCIAAYAAAQAGEAYTELHCNTQTQDHRRLGQSPATMPMLRQHQTKSKLSVKLVTQ
jgi:SRSO17 transposase